MQVSRRTILGGLGLAVGAQSGLAKARASLPFELEGIYLDAAFTHPIGAFARSAATRYIEQRRIAPQSVGPRANPRNEAVQRFARLIGAGAKDIAVVPSTLEAENRIAMALGLGIERGVVTDALHYDGALALYDHLSRGGTPVSVVRPVDNRIRVRDIEAALTPSTRLIAVSLVSSVTGFMHDLSDLCAMAHRHGVLVYADAVQAAGAVPIDVRASGVDFLACGTYKWLMGDYGCAFLYCRPDRLDQLKRIQVGWRQLSHYESHVLPFEPVGPAIGTLALSGGVSGLFEVSTPAWNSLAVVSASLEYIETIGIEAIARNRRPLIDQLREELEALGLQTLTPRGTPGPIIAFALEHAERRLSPELKAAGIQASLYKHRLRVSPSVYNDPADVDALIRAVDKALRG